MFVLSKFLKGHSRLYCNIAARNSIEHLKSRALIRVKGSEAHDFLQGLMTNDMQHLIKSTRGSMYTMFLNTKGRVLYDSIVYKIENETYFIECDVEIVNSLQKHMMLYRIRRKIDICSLENDYKIYVLFNSNIIKNQPLPLTKDNSEIKLNDLSVTDKLMIFKDPRVNDLGYRIISTSDVDIKQELNNLTNSSFSDSTDSYKLLRYALGIGEGTNDLPVGNCFPLESNCDYLHGVSFHKGCYIGQELTARTHHTGVVRKRLMPLYFKNSPTILPDDNRLLVDKSNLGKLRGIKDTFGLALLRVDLALDFGEFKIGNEIAKVFKPHWWPVTLPKEKLIQKT